jgi:hypothetical protein
VVTRVEDFIRISAGIVFGILMTGCAAVGPKQPVEDAETQRIVADALLILPRYFEWPEGAFVLRDSPLMFGIYGRTALADALKAQAKERRVGGREIMVREFWWPATPNCNVLLISRSEQRRIDSILQKVAHAPVLTISRFEDFRSEACAVRFYVDEGKARFQVNMAAVSNAQLRASSHLLNVADVTWAEPKKADARGPADKPAEGKSPRRTKQPFRMKNAE